MGPSCPSSLSNERFWVNYKYLFPTNLECFFKLLQAPLNSQTHKFGSRAGVTISEEDFGGLEGLRYLDDIAFNRGLICSFADLIKYLEKHGYSEKKDLFGCPYDWRIVGFNDGFNEKLKALVEVAYSRNGNQKVAILGYSLGSIVLTQFLGNYVSDSWRDKYIKKVVFLAPAFGGSSDALKVSYTQEFPFLPHLHMNMIKNAINNMPALHALLPNHEVFGSTPLIYDKDGKVYTAKEIPDFLINHNKVSGNGVTILRNNAMNISSHAPIFPRVPTYIIYNTGLDTALDLHLKSKGFFNKYRMGSTKGDGTVPHQGPEWACKNWKQEGIPVVCHNMDNNHENYNHQKLSQNSYVSRKIYNAVINDDWMSDTRSRMIVAPYVFADNVTYSVAKDVRAKTITYLA